MARCLLLGHTLSLLLPPGTRYGVCLLDHSVASSWRSHRQFVNQQRSPSVPELRGFSAEGVCTGISPGLSSLTCKPLAVYGFATTVKATTARPKTAARGSASNSENGLCRANFRI